MAKKTTVAIKADRAILLSNVTVAWYAFDDSKSAFVVAGKAALNGGISSDDLLTHIRHVHIWKCLGNPADTFQPAPVLALLAKPGFNTKQADDVKRTAKEEAAYDAAKTQVSRARGALGLIASGKASAPESNAAQIARRKADKVAADKVKAQSDLAAPKHTAWPEADASWMALADMLEQRVKQNPEFVRGPVAKDALTLVKSIREHCQPIG